MKGESLEDRLWGKIMPEPNSGCWLWIASDASATRYGVLWVNGRHEKAHRVSYELYKGSIPPGLCLDHLCRNRRCVNPDHLEPVTSRENTLRGVGLAAMNARKTHCMRGHPLSGNNLLRWSDGDRRCRQCHTERERQRRRAAR